MYNDDRVHITFKLIEAVHSFTAAFLCGVVYTVTKTSIFTARAYARAVLGVVILSVCPSVTGVDCDKNK